MKNKDIKDYLHFYLGCAYIGKYKEWAHENNVMYLCPADLINGKFEYIKPILRQLSDMTEEEAAILDEMARTQEDSAIHIGGKAKFFAGIRTKSAEAFRWLLSKHFDLFGLIDAGLAIDKTKTP